MTFEQLTLALSILLLPVLGVLAYLIPTWLKDRTSRVQAVEACRQAVLAREQAQQEIRQTNDELRTVRQELSDGNSQIARLETQIATQQQAHEQRVADLTRLQEQTLTQFEALSQKALNSEMSEFLKRANEKFDAVRIRANDEFEQRQKAIDALVKPVHDSLEKQSKTLQEIEKQRAEAHTRIHEQINQLRSFGDDLRKETTQLTLALKGSQTRGSWGEQTLRRCVEFSGMTEHVDFSEQVSLTTQDGARQRPDMVIHLPEGRQIVIDAKAVIDAYRDAMDEEKSEEERRQLLAGHARHVRDQVNLLGSKAYWSQFEQSPDFVVLFLPSDGHLAEAFRFDPSLMEDAARQNVIMATPMSLIALLKAVSWGWRQEQLARNARDIMTVGQAMHDRLVTLMGHAERLGKSLRQAVEHYNGFVGSLERSALSQARKFQLLGIHSGTTTLPEAPVMESQVREFRSLPEYGGSPEPDGTDVEMQEPFPDDHSTP